MSRFSVLVSAMSVIMTSALSLCPLTAKAQSLCVDGGGAGGCPTEVTLGGRHVFESVTVTNGGVIYVQAYNGADKQNTGNLELIAPWIYVDASSSVNADGRGYSAVRCGDGKGPTPESSGKGGCAVRDSGGGGGHFGNGGRGTKDMSNLTPTLADWEEDCGNSLNAAGSACIPTTNCRNNDALPTVAGQKFFHSIWEPEFGASGADKGCRDGDGFGAQPLVAGFGGGRIVLAGIDEAGTGVVNVQGTIRSMGWRGCGTGNDSAGGGAGGTVLILGDSVTIGSTAKVWANGGTGGDTQNLNGNDTNVHPTYGFIPYELYRGQGCPAGAQNGGTCDDCGGGGGGGIIAVMSRAAASIAGTADFDVNGAVGGSCDRCRGEAGGQAGELQLSYGYRGEICDGYDNDFDGATDEGLGSITCNIGSCAKEVPACTDGQLGYCIDEDDPNCIDPDPDTRPRFAIIVDTSGSMLLSLDGTQYVFGDGSSGHEGRDLDNNGEFDDSRLHQAKNALSQVIAAYPEVDWSLLRYHQDQGLDRSCQQAAWFECADVCCTYDNPFANTNPSGSPRCVIDSQNVYPDSPAATRCIHYAGTCGSVGNGADVLTGFGASINDYLLWLDHTEDADAAGIDDIEPGAHCTGHNCELRATGPTPLADSLLAVRRYLEGAQRTDPYSDCRPYYVILLTDGAESCNGNPVDAAQSLFESTGIETLVIGFSVTAQEQTQLNQIARAGSGNTRDAFYATNEAELASTLASIVADSIIYEECNGIDDDCDGLTDEDFSQLDQPCDDGGIGICRGTGHYVCSADEAGVECLITDPGQPPAGEELCNGLDDNCNGQIDEGACDDCIPSGADICDGVDNDCDGETDEDFVPEACGIDEGECVAGLTDCIDGELVCDGTEPSEEICNNKDDDCDGLTDGIYVPCYPGGTIGCSGDPLVCVGMCHAGQSLCTAGELGLCEGPTIPTEEVCDGYDNDCDGETDELYDLPCWSGPAYPEVGVCHPGTRDCIGPGIFSECEGEVIATEEICDGLDNDCDGLTDEATQICGGCDDPLECTAGAQAGECSQGLRSCDTESSIAAGEPVWSSECTGSVGPEIEVCDGKDNDCDGITDEVTNPCGGCDNADPAVCPAGPNAGVCRQGISRCDSAEAISAGHPVWRECVGSIGPSLEICDGLDNDCDGETDEGLALVGQECAKAMGECEAATLECVNLTTGGKGIQCCASVDPSTGECVPPQGPEVETCDGKDNNCDSLTDEGLVVPCGGCVDAGCTSDLNEGQCQEGLSRCVEGKWGDCQGSTGPTAESCNLLDDDCDGLTDEDVMFSPSTCSHANTADPNEGICEPGNWTCNEKGNPECLGGVKPSVEVCNGLDDDCDGKQDWDTDEELDYVGEPCGSSNLGVCKRGAYQCLCDTDLAECELVCVGGVLPSNEECNCLDDDCDGQTDEEIPEGGSCNNAPGEVATGACTDGSMRCIDCDWVCDAPHPGLESCNGIDDDCDGSTDENLDVECPKDHVCIEGECAPPCFGQEAGCPSGAVCEEVYNPGTGEMVRVCVSDVCSPGVADALPCASNPYYCSDESAIPPCRCDSVRKSCVSPCEDLVCQEGEVCVATVTNNKVSAQCVKTGPGCYGAGCPDNKKCENGKCVADPCAGKTCEEEEYCKNGECVGVCAEQDCPVSCRDGECVDDPCAGKLCDPGLSCNPQTGKCAQGDCWQKSCEYYQICKDGQCVDDPCWNVDCPNGRRCLDGSCYDVDFEPSGGSQGTDGPDTDSLGPGTDSDGSDEDSDTGRGSLDEEAELTKVLVTGAGGCLCAATPGRGRGSHGLLWLLLLPSFAVMLRLRRRGKRPPLWLFGPLVMLVSMGCQVEPFEFGGSADSGGTDTLETDTRRTDTSSTDDTDDTQNSGTLDIDTETCRPDEPDNDCDGVDDDCDGLTDEDADLGSPANCGKCGNVCSYEHAFALCVDGECQRGQCAPFWHDRDDNPDDCEFFCQPTVDPSDNLDLCDGVDIGDTDTPYAAVDNDCDGEFDEDVDILQDARNCGRCGNICRVPGAVAICVGGQCGQGDCREAFYDNDSDTGNGCEYQCMPTEEGVEICDGKDNDCDGLTDENADDPSSSWGAQGGDACYTAEDGGCESDGTNCKGTCTAGTWKCEARQLRCKNEVKAAQGELCDNLDNDCDGITDEEDDIPLMGPDGSLCAVQVGVCPEGRLRCARPALGEPREKLCCASVDSNGVCIGVRDGIPDHEDTNQCDGLDNDCDGKIDESPSDPNVGMTGPECFFGQLWGEGNPDVKGPCLDNPGAFRCYYGTWVCEGAASPTAEICNGIDDNCDDQIDEGLYQACQTQDYEEKGLCRYGIRACVQGSFENGACQGEILPEPEPCDLLDNDCDGLTDEADDIIDTDLGLPCNQGICQGSMACDSGVMRCVGGSPPKEEIPCNQLDDDCDGEIDERVTLECGGCDGSSPFNLSCAHGTNEGVCQQGSWICEGTNSVCSGHVGPSVEVCNDEDDDCDGVTDEGFDKLSDPNNCGGCGVTCGLPHTTTRCNDGECEVLGCEFGWVDLDTDAAGCEYSCVKTGAEICDGRDNDCNGLTDGDDPALFTPANFCRQLGECAGSEPVCSRENGVWGWYCDYDPVTVELSAPNQIALQETLCDTLDNDCDGLTDESFPLKGQPCSEVTDPEHPHGICLSTGLYQCSANMTETVCQITVPGQTPGIESCNGRDDDCNGLIDEGELDEWVPISHHSLTFQIYKYEASRVDATGSATGIATSRSCSKKDVMPWSGATFYQAWAACAAAGGRLCTAQEWLAACEGSMPYTTYPYGDTYSESICNGKDFQEGSELSVPAGSLDDCISEDGAFDLSGNLREWTLDPSDTDEPIHVVRGGSFNTPAIGLTCAFTMSRADNDVVLPAIGFRCCRDE